MVRTPVHSRYYRHGGDTTTSTSSSTSYHVTVHGGTIPFLYTLYCYCYCCYWMLLVPREVVSSFHWVVIPITDSTITSTINRHNRNHNGLHHLHTLKFNTKKHSIKHAITHIHCKNNEDNCKITSRSKQPVTGIQYSLHGDDDHPTTSRYESHVTFTKHTKQWNSLLLVCVYTVVTMIIATTTTTLTSVPLVVNAATTATMTQQHYDILVPQQVDVNKNKNNNKNNKNNDETISGFIAGAALTATKTIVKYPMDTATVRLQMPNSTYSIYQPIQLFQNSYVGIITPLVSNIPAGAVFFAVKDTISSILKSIAVTTTPSTTVTSTITTSNDDVSVLLIATMLLQQLCTSRTFRTCVAVAVAQIPYWIVRNPSEVVKTKEQAGVVTTNDDLDGNGGGGGQYIVTDLTAQFNVTGLFNRCGIYYTGFWENIIYAYPADVLKFVCYEQLSSRHLLGTIFNNNQDNPLLSGMETALYGAIATALAQYITTPLDVIRNRIMANVTSVTSNASNISSTVIHHTVHSSHATATAAAAAVASLHGLNTPTVESSMQKTSSPSFLTTYTRSIILLGQNEGWDGLFAGSIPRLMKAFISGAIQFATYEETKQALITFLSHKT